MTLSADNYKQLLGDDVLDNRLIGARLGAGPFASTGVFMGDLAKQIQPQSIGFNQAAAPAEINDPLISPDLDLDGMDLS